MSNRHDYLDCAKGISIFLVVIFHSTIALQEYDLAHSQYWLFNNFMSSIRMPVFFFISGFLAKSATSSPDQKKLAGKVINFLYLFSLWSIIQLMVQTASPISSNPSFDSWLSFLYSPSSVLWFIWALVIFFCVARAGQMLNKEVIFAVSVCLSLSTYAGLIGFSNYAHNNVLMFLPMFLCGAWYSDILVKTSFLRHLLTFPISFSVFVIIFVVFYQIDFPEVMEGLISFPMSFLGIIVGLSASILLCRFRSISYIPVFLGQNTLGVYVAHYPIVVFMAGIVNQISLKSPVVGLAGVSIISVLSIILSLGLKMILEKLNLGWLYILPTKSVIQRHIPLSN